MFSMEEALKSANAGDYISCREREGDRPVAITSFGKMDNPTDLCGLQASDTVFGGKADLARLTQNLRYELRYVDTSTLLHEIQVSTFRVE